MSTRFATMPGQLSASLLWTCLGGAGLCGALSACIDEPIREATPATDTQPDRPDAGRPPATPVDAAVLDFSDWDAHYPERMPDASRSEDGGPPVCTPHTRAAACGSRECDSVPDGCGGSVECGTCAAPETCGGDGTPGLCGCTAQTRQQACGSRECESVPDGCGGTIECDCDEDAGVR